MFVGALIVVARGSSTCSENPAVGSEPHQAVGTVEGHPEVALGVQRETVGIGAGKLHASAAARAAPSAQDRDSHHALGLRLDDQERVPSGVTTQPFG